VTLLLVPIVLVAVSLPGLSTEAQSPAQSLPEQRIEIVIRDYDFQVAKPAPIQPGLPTVVIIRNQDIVRHGFHSAMLQGILVQGEGEGVAAYGKGVEGFYVDPGKTLVIRFNNQRAGKYSFRCDLHPKMKGEAYVMEVPAA
jgi:plastocyanin